MAVQVPVINRNAPQETASVGRMDVPVADGMKAYGIQEKAAESLVKATGEFVEKQEDYAADTKSTEIANNYHTWYNEKLRGKNGIAYQKGDPTEAYKKFDEDAKAEYDKYITQSGDYSQRTRDAVVSKLNSTYHKVYESRSTLEGKQTSDYTTRVTNDAIDLTKSDVIDATANLDISDPNATVPIDRVLNNIRDLRYKEGLKTGQVRETTDPNEIDPFTKQPKVTKVETDPSVRAKTEKDVSDALNLAIGNLSAAGDTEGAEFLLKKYESDLRGPQRNKLEKEVTKASKDQEAKDVVNEIMTLSPEKAQAKIDSIEDADVRENAAKRYDSEQRRRENVTKRYNKTNYNLAAKTVIQRQLDGNGFQDEVEMMDDKTVKRVWANMDSKQQQALIHMVNQPKDSDQETKAALFTKLTNGEFRGMSYEDFSEQAAGLNKEDRKMFENQLRKFNTQTPGQETQSVKWMGSQLTKELQSIGYVKKDSFGKYSNKDQIKLNNANSQMIDAIDKFAPDASYKEKQDWIKKFAADTIKGGGALPDVPTRFNGGAKPRDVTPKAIAPAQANPQKSLVTVPGASGSIDMNSLKQGQQDYYKKFGRWPDLKTTELQDFMKKAGK